MFELKNRDLGELWEFIARLWVGRRENYLQQLKVHGLSIGFTAWADFVTRSANFGKFAGQTA